MSRLLRFNYNVRWIPICIYVCLLYIFAPTPYSINFNILCTVSYITLIYLYCKELHKKNYFDFDTLFFIAYFFVSFFYPTFIYPVNPEMFWIFEYATDSTVISRATALSLLGITAYMYGSVGFKSVKKKEIMESYRPIKTTGLFIISVCSFIIYIALGGYSALKNTYASGEREQGGLYAYFSIIVYICIFCMITCWFMNSYHKSNCKLQRSCFPIFQVGYILTIVR